MTAPAPQPLHSVELLPEIQDRSQRHYTVVARFELEAEDAQEVADVISHTIAPSPYLAALITHVGRQKYCSPLTTTQAWLIAIASALLLAGTVTGVQLLLRL